MDLGRDPPPFLVSMADRVGVRPPYAGNLELSFGIGPIGPIPKDRTVSRRGDGVEDRRGGPPAAPGARPRARRPAAPSTAMTASRTTGTVTAPRRRRGEQDPAEHGAQRQPDQRAERGDDHRLQAQYRPGLATGLAHRPQQADLAAPLVDRQRQRVGDAEQGDDDGQGEQDVDER